VLPLAASDVRLIGALHARFPGWGRGTLRRQVTNGPVACQRLQGDPAGPPIPPLSTGRENSA
jgi:hypothetical protein